MIILALLGWGRGTRRIREGDGLGWACARCLGRWCLWGKASYGCKAEGGILKVGDITFAQLLGGWARRFALTVVATLDLGGRILPALDAVWAVGAMRLAAVGTGGGMRALGSSGPLGLASFAKRAMVLGQVVGPAL